MCSGYLYSRTFPLRLLLPGVYDQVASHPLLLLFLFLPSFITLHYVLLGVQHLNHFLLGPVTLVVEV